MRKNLILFILFLSAQQLIAQNLVQNASFEELFVDSGYVKVYKYNPRYYSDHRVEIDAFKHWFPVRFMGVLSLRGGFQKKTGCLL